MHSLATFSATDGLNLRTSATPSPKKLYILPSASERVDRKKYWLIRSPQRNLHSFGKVLLFISDGLKGITDRIFAVFPDIKRTASTCRAEICEDLKSVYRTESRELGKEELEAFVDKWKTTYPKITKSLELNPYIFTL